MATGRCLCMVLFFRKNRGMLHQCVLSSITAQLPHQLRPETPLQAW